MRCWFLFSLGKKYYGVYVQIEISTIWTKVMGT